MSIEDKFDQRRVERHTRRLMELRAWRNARVVPIPDWRLTASDGRERPLRLGEAWPIVETPVRLTASTQIPTEWAGQPVELELWLGGEGFVKLSTGLQAGLNPYHKHYRVTEVAQGGEPLTIEAEVVPKGLFGSHVSNPRIERAQLVIPQRDVRALEGDISLLLRACRELGDHEAVPLLLDVVDAAYAATGLAWPSASATVISRYVDTAAGQPGAYSDPHHTVDIQPLVTRLWSLPESPEPIGPLPEGASYAVERARATIDEGLARVKKRYPPVGRLALTGHAHIDLAWLWPVAETRRKVRRTFSTALMLMERYEEFTFNQSSAQAYAWLEEDDPALLERIKERVAAGQWEPVGGSWTEPDCQITSGEAFVRQLVYGQRYFERTFGRRHTVAWLPDVFGFSPGVPQLLRGAGLTGFFTIKVNWSETNLFPYDLFHWEGIDGTAVLAHTFRNPAQGYNGNIAPEDTLGTWRNFRGKRHHDESLLSFGWGDGGGGPTDQMLDNFQRLRDFPALPKLRMATVGEFFASLPTEGIPRWVGELYLEYHRGTLTTQAKVKALNRAAEHRLVEAEACASLASLDGFSYPGSELEAAWKRLLFNQFHDVLPGSSIKEVYEDTFPELEEVVATAERLRDSALRHLGGDGDGLLIANAGLNPRPLVATLSGLTDGQSVRDAAGTVVPAQAVDEGLLVCAPNEVVPGLGWLRLTVADGAADTTPYQAVRAAERSGGAVLENDLLRVDIGADGTLHHVFDKTASREALAERGNQVWAYVDKPRVYDAWDIEESYELEGEEIGQVEQIEIVEKGPLRGAVRVRRAWRDSRMTQTYRLLAGSRRLDILTEIDWHERMMLLKARFPLAVHTREATFETMYGAHRRPTHRNTTWDLARFEVSGHRFADLSEPGYGVALLNDAKYGHSAHANVLTLSLLRGPIYPDPFADEGPNRFTYSLFPHPGDWTEAGVEAEALALNSPLIAVPAGNGAADGSLLTAEGLPLSLGALKRAEDGHGLILRAYEPHGARGTATLRFTRPVVRAERVNLLEDAVDEGELVIEAGDAIRLDVRPFEVVSMRVMVGQTQHKRR